LSHREKTALVERDNPPLSLTRQVMLLGISRSGLYYAPKINPEDIRIGNAMDEIFTKHPFFGSRRISIALRDYGTSICRDHVRSHMRTMGLEAVHPKKRLNLSITDTLHHRYPYLLANLPIVRPNQVWGTDITYIRLAHGFCYLVALLDWYSRYVETISKPSLLG
jgi:putative transposase